ncbi:MAG TPA: glycosyltransferase [Candidatus Paceibacterota bacterium]|nr:glycosyltransferase [Candidatus Paceibacterota bacterium]
MIDVIIPTYNRKAALEKVIGSYLAQEFLSTIIIVDDCSTDDTRAWVSALSKKHPSKIRYHRLKKNVPLPEVRNIGIALAESEFIFMGEDDVMLPNNHFEILLRKLHERNADIISGRRINLYPNQTLEEAKNIADRDHEPVYVRVPFEAYFDRFVEQPLPVYVLHSNVLMKRSVAAAVLYDPLYDGNAFREETDFFLRAYMTGFRLWFIPDTLSYHMKNMQVNAKGGSRKNRFLYEWHVWKNTARLFMHNRAFFEQELGIRHIRLFLIRCLFARYAYALKRRILYKVNERRYETT